MPCLALCDAGGHPKAMVLVPLLAKLLAHMQPLVYLLVSSSLHQRGRVFWCSMEVMNYGYPGQSQSLQKYPPVPSVPGGRDGASPASLHSVSWTQREQETLLPWPSVTEQGPGSGNFCHDLCLCHPMYSLLSAKRDRLSAACPKPSWGAVNHHCLHLLTPLQPVDLSTPIVPTDLP